MSAQHTLPVRDGETAKKPGIPNKPAEGISYFTPAQIPPAGTASDPQPGDVPIPKIFQPLKIRSVTLQNRIMLSPLCQYSASNGHITPWHLAHLGGILTRGPGLTMIEATSITPEGRITPEDSGIWLDSQAEKLAEIVEFAHSQNQKIGLQIGHAGRKASTIAPWLSRVAVATEDVGGWPQEVVAPSAVPYDEARTLPKALSLDDIEELKKAWVAAVKRAVKAGFDVIEIHNAHGYLLHEFLTPVSNKRTDKYGGSFENRTRLTLEIAELTRKNIPEGMPLFLRISGTDWLADRESWTVDDTVKLAPLLASAGVDLLDVTSGGAHADQKVVPGPGYQVPLAKAVKAAVGEKLLVGTVGSITSGKQAEAILTGKGEGSHGEQEVDLAIVGRGFQKNPGLVWAWAEELGTEIKVANQIGWGFGGRVGAPRKKH